MREDIQRLSFLVYVSLYAISSSSLHLYAIFLYRQIVFYSVYVPHFHHLFVRGGALKLFSFPRF